MSYRREDYAKGHRGLMTKELKAAKSVKAFAVLCLVPNFVKIPCAFGSGPGRR